MAETVIPTWFVCFPVRRRREAERKGECDFRLGVICVGFVCLYVTYNNNVIEIGKGSFLFFFLFYNSLVGLV